MPEEHKKPNKKEKSVKNESPSFFTDELLIMEADMSDSNRIVRFFSESTAEFWSAWAVVLTLFYLMIGTIILTTPNWFFAKIIGLILIAPTVVVWGVGLYKLVRESRTQ